MRIRVYAALRDPSGASKFDLPPDASTGTPTTVGQVLRRLAAEHPGLAGKLWADDDRLTGHVTVLLNGRSVEYLAGMDTPVQDTDTLSLFPPVGGG